MAFLEWIRDAMISVQGMFSGGWIAELFQRIIEQFRFIGL